MGRRSLGRSSEGRTTSSRFVFGHMRSALTTRTPRSFATYRTARSQTRTAPFAPSSRKMCSRTRTVSASFSATIRSCDTSCRRARAMAHATRLAQALRLDLAAQWTPTEGELSQSRDQGADPAGPCAKPKARHWRSSSTILKKGDRNRFNLPHGQPAKDRPRSPSALC
jgi:hypothetical protein